MGNECKWLVILVVALCLELHGTIAGKNQVKGPDQEIDPLTARNLLTTDFENGMGEWFDSSSGDVNWFLESFDSPTEGIPAPEPAEGTKYLRIVRRILGSSGTASLRSPTFTAFPGDKISFKFWIRSRHLQTNNLEVYWLNGTREERLLSLAEYSSPSNFEWRTVSALIPTLIATNTKIIFYGYCGYNDEDSVAIDDVAVGSSLDLSTTNSPMTTVTKPPCPRYLGGLTYAPCYLTGTGCYCYYQHEHTWYNADTVCRNYSMTLVSLESEEEDKAVSDIIRGDPYVTKTFYSTSGMFSSMLGRWSWASGNAFNYTNWKPGEPNGDGDCVHLNPNDDYKWADTPCYWSSYFICEQ